MIVFKCGSIYWDSFLVGYEKPPGVSLGGFSLFSILKHVYNLNMELALYTAAFGVFFLTAVALVGGAIAYVYDCFVTTKKPALTWASYHAPRWGRDGSVVARHEHCRTCEITVVSAGGQPVSHSSME